MITGPKGEAEAAWESEDVLRRQLARIEASEAVRKSGRLCDLLLYLFEETLAGRGAQISQYSIAFDCLKLGDNFDSSKSSVVRVHARNLRQALVDYYQGSGASDEVVVMLSKVGYTLVFERKPSSSPYTTLATEWPTMGLLEFKGLGLDGDWKHLPAVLAEELSVVITGQGGLRFLGPFSRTLLEKDGLDPLLLGTRHDLDFILDGSVQRAGNTLTLRTRLLEGRSGLQIWAGKNELQLDHPDIAGFEESLMRRLSDAIGGDYGTINRHLHSLARVRPENALTVYESVLTARSYFAEFQMESLHRSMAVLRQAVRQIPNEALPHATLAVVLASTSFEHRWHGELPLDEIRFHAQRAWQLRPADPWSILAKAFSASVHRERTELSLIGVAVEADAHASAMVKGGVGLLLCYQKLDVERGLRLIEQAFEGNPHYPDTLHLARAIVWLDAGDLEKARLELDAFNIPWGWSDPLLRAAIAALQGDHETALGEWRRVIAVYPNLARDGLRSIGYLWHADYLNLIVEALQRAGISLDPELC